MHSWHYVKHSFYRVANGIFGKKIDRIAPEDVVIQLLKS